MLRSIIIAAAVAVTAGSVIAQTSVTASRKAWMKENGAATGQGAAMVKGEAPFDLAKAKAIFKTYKDTANRLPRLFPASSMKGEETAAAEAIWKNPAGWRAAVAAFRRDVATNEPKIKDLDSFKAAFGAVTKNCGSCHEAFRVKKS